MSTAVIVQIADKIMSDLGAGYSESIYQNAIFRKLILLDETSCMEKIIPVVYEGDMLGSCRADIVTMSHVVEVKAVRKMPSGAGKQVCKYLKHLEEADGLLRTGLVVNFNQDTEKLESMEFRNESSTESMPEAKRRKFVPADG
jgi:GxxExxY protein